MKFLVLFSLTMMMCVPDTRGPWREITQNGMTFRWKVTGNMLEGSVHGPLQGWVAVGVSPRTGIVGSNLLMFRVDEAGAYGEDQYVTGAGVHPTIASLGGRPGLRVVSGEQSADGTTVHFELMLYDDGYHPQFQAGDACSLTLAYSVVDEFDHHSRMRTEAEITW